MNTQIQKVELDNIQSLQLIALGISELKASSGFKDRDGKEWVIFDMVDLFQMLPIRIDSKEDVYVLYFYYDNYRHKWIAGYKTLGSGKKLCEETEKELVDALFELVKICIIRLYIKIESPK